MISVKVKENEMVERALKRLKKKNERASILREYRRRKHYTKPSIERRHMRSRAIYRQLLLAKQD